jgi:hypothetical protein
LERDIIFSKKEKGKRKKEKGKRKKEKGKRKKEKGKRKKEKAKRKKEKGKRKKEKGKRKKEKGKPFHAVFGLKTSFIAQRAHPLVFDNQPIFEINRVWPPAKRNFRHVEAHVIYPFLIGII